MCLFSGNTLFLNLMYIMALSESSHFDSRLSHTFQLTNKSFDLSYMDGTELSGYVCRDRIKIGHFETTSNFGCISPRHRLFMFSGQSSGILGMGFPADNHESANTNLLVSITSSSHNNEGNYTSPPSLLTKVFTLIIDNDGGGALQLGGIDLTGTRNARLEDAFEAPVVAECQGTGPAAECRFTHFRVAVDSVRVGKSSSRRG